MAAIKDLYNKDVIENIVKSYSDEDVADVDPNNNPFNQITLRTHNTGVGSVLFSTLFGWAPVTIPDIPIRVFQHTDWDPEAQLYIPEVDNNWVWNHEVTEAFALAMYEGDTTLLHGLQGTGKSGHAQQWCATCVLPFWRMSCNRETREAHFLGSPGVHYDQEGRPSIKQEPTLLTDSLRYGGLFCEDEAFRHNSALVLQSLREKTNRTVILPDAPGRTASERKLKAPVGRWWYVLTDNTTGSGDETGIFDCEVQDASTLDRIDTAIEVPYLDKQSEIALLKGHSTLNETIINGMVNMATLVRTAFGKQTIMATLSVRGLLAWANKIELMGDIAKALRVSWYNKLGSDDQAVVADMFHQVFQQKING
jgi:cobaltochelatase CobS